MAGLKPSDRHQRLLAAAALLALGGLLWLAWALGQRSVILDPASAGAEIAALEQSLAAARQRELEQQERLVRLETDHQISAEAYRQVEGQLAALQATIMAQQEDLAFFRGLISDTANGDDIRVQNLIIIERPQPAAYTLQLVLAQPMGQERRVSGHVEIDIEGMIDQAATSLDLAAITTDAGSSGQLEFSFRYFQNLEADLVLPAGFVPARLVLRLVPSGRGAEPREQRFEWRTQAG